MDQLIGMLSPVALDDFADLMPEAVRAGGYPKGLGGSPANLLARELIRRGRRLVIFTLDPTVTQEVVIECRGVRICIGPFRPRRARDFFREEIAYLISAVSREKPDVLHAQWVYENTLAAQATGLPTVATAHDAPWNILRLNFIPYRIIRTLMALKSIRRIPLLAAVSPYVEQHLRRYCLFRGDSEIVPNGVPGAFFQLRAVPREPGSNPVFATVLPNWGTLKNGEAAIAAFGILRRSLPGARMVMFGQDYGPGQTAERWAQAAGIAENIEFAGRTPHAELMRRLGEDVDALVHPSREEAHSMAIIEAMAVGLPVIGGKRSGSVPWTLDYGKAGLLVDINDPEDIARAMELLAKDREQRSAIARAGHEYALATCSIERVADTYERLYLRALSTQGQQAR